MAKRKRAEYDAKDRAKKSQCVHFPAKDPPPKGEKLKKAKPPKRDKQGYLKFADFPKFRPNLTPKEVKNFFKKHNDFHALPFCENLQKAQNILEEVFFFRFMN